MDEQQVENEVADSEPQGRGGPWKLIAVVVIATLIGVWLVPGDDQALTGIDEGGTTADGQDLPSLLDLPPTAAGGDPILPEALEPAPVDTTPGARARAFIAKLRSSGDIPLDEVFAAATEAQDRRELADAYLLYFFAAREGHAKSALALGRQADPATRDPANSVFEAADLTQAHKWYQIAARNGADQAPTYLNDLRSRVEQLAAGGDPQAQRITLLWQ